MKNVIHFGAVSLDWTLPVSKWERDIIFAYFWLFLHIFASGPSNKSTDRCCSWPCFRICVGGSGPALTCLATVPGLLCLVAKNLYLMNLCICAWTCVGASLWLLYTFVALIYICIYLHFATWFHLVLQGGRSARGFETLKLEGVTQPTADSLLLEKSDCRKPQEWPLTFRRSRRCTFGLTHFQGSLHQFRWTLDFQLPFFAESL